MAETDPFAPLQDLLAKRKEAAANKPAPTARVPGALDVALKQVREKKAEVQEARFGAPPDDLKERTQYLQETLGVQTPSYTDSEGNAVETSDAPTTAPQPQTVPAVVEEAVAAQEPAQAPLDPYAALQTDLGGLSLKETKEVEDVEKQINAREATRAAEWIDFDRSAAENAATVFAKALGKQEDVFRAIIKGFELPGGNYRMPGLNALGVDWAVPGQSDEDVAMARELLIRTPTIKGEISRATGIPEGAIRISATPQDKTVGMAYNETVAAITDIQYLKLLQEANATVASGISQAEKNGLRVKARKFAIQQADSASAAAIGRNFPVIERDSNATAKWISEWGPLWRPILAGYYQDNATIRLPNGEHYEEDLTQNTFFGGLEWAVQAISPTTKPFAAGAITGEKLGKDDILEFLDNPALMAFGALSASAAVEMSMPDGYETSIPYDVSEEGVKHMRRGEDLISQHDKLGGAAGEYLWSPAGADASLAEQGGKAIAQTWLSAIHRMNPITGYMLYNGWTDAQITSVAFTAAGALLEPDAFMAVAPLKAGAKLGSGLYKARKAAKIDTRVGEILTKMDTPVQVLDDAGDAVVDATGKPVMELPRVDEMELSKLLSKETGVNTENVLLHTIQARTNDLVAGDPSVVNAFQAAAKKREVANIARKAAGADLEVADSPLLKHLAEIDELNADVALKAADEADLTGRLQMLAGRAKIVGKKAVDGSKVNVTTATTAARKVATKLLKTVSELRQHRAATANDISKLKDAIELRNNTARASQLIRTEGAAKARNAKFELDSWGRTIAAYLPAGTKLPTNVKGVNRLLSLVSEDDAVTAIKAYRKALEELLHVKAQYKPLIKHHQKLAADARLGLKGIRDNTGAVKAWAKEQALLRAVMRTNNTLSRHNAILDAGRTHQQQTMLKAAIKDSRKAQKLARAKSAALNKQIGGVGRKSPELSDVKGVMPDLWRKYHRQATREMLDSIRQHANQVAKVPHDNAGEVKSLMAKITKDITPDGMMREIDGPVLTAAVDAMKPGGAWLRIPGDDAQLIQSAMAGVRGLTPDMTGRLETALSRLIREVKEPALTPRDEMGKLFWAEVHNQDAILVGSNIPRRAAQAIRGLATSFGQTGRLGEIAAPTIEVVSAGRRAAHEMQQEIYNILMDNGVDTLFRWFDTTDGIDTRYGTTIANQGTRTIFSRFIERIQALHRVSETVDDTELIDTAADILAIARGFMPDSVTISKELDAKVVRAVLTSIATKTPGTSAKLYNSLPHTIARTLGEHFTIGAGVEDSTALWLKRVRKAMHRVDTKTGSNKHLTGFAGGIAHGAMMKRVSDGLINVTLGKFDVDDVQAARRLMDGTLAKEGGDLDAAVKVLNHMGMTLMQGSPKAPGLGDKVKTLMLIGTDKSGAAAFAPKVLLDELNSEVEGIIKSIEAISAKGRGNVAVEMAKSGFTRSLRAVMVGIVRGYLMPKPKRFINASVQNASQIAVNEGFLTAARVAARSMGSNVSWVIPSHQQVSGVLGDSTGAVYKRLQAQTSELLGGHPVLPTGIQSMLAGENYQIFAGAKGVLRLPGGGMMTYDEVRKLATEAGILEGTLRGEFGAQMKRAAKAGDVKLPDGSTVGPERFTTAWAKQYFTKEKERFFRGVEINDNWVTDAIETMEQRQRMELFMDLLKRGVPPDQAASRTIDALYDWSSPVSHWEMALLVGKVPFYRVFRNGAAHAVRSLTEPFTAPTAGYMARGLFGQTRMGRTRAQTRIGRMYSEFGDHDPAQDGVQFKSDTKAGRLVMPGWVTGRNFARVDGITQEESDKLLRQTGERYDQVVTLHPAMAVLEEMDMVVGSALAGWAAMQAATDAVIHPNDRRYLLPQDFYGRVAESAASYIGVATPEVLDAWAEAQRSGNTGRVKLKRGEATLAKQIAFGGTGLDDMLGMQTDLDGTVTVNKFGFTVMKLVPSLGPQWMDLYKAWYNKTSEEDPATLRAWYTFAHSVGASREYYSNSQEQIERRGADTVRMLEAKKKSFE